MVHGAMRIDLHAHYRPSHDLDLLEAAGIALSKAAWVVSRGNGAENACDLLGIG